MSLQKEYENEHELLLEKYRGLIRTEVKKMYAEGVIIEDHIGKGRVIKPLIRFYSQSVQCEVGFHCKNLTKKEEVNKREPERVIYLLNIKECADEATAKLTYKQ